VSLALPHESLLLCDQLLDLITKAGVVHIDTVPRALGSPICCA
jgi:hypothetical protein